MYDLLPKKTRLRVAHQGHGPLQKQKQIHRIHDLQHSHKASWDPFPCGSKRTWSFTKTKRNSLHWRLAIFSPGSARTHTFVRLVPDNGLPQTIQIATAITQFSLLADELQRWFSCISTMSSSIPKSADLSFGLMAFVLPYYPCNKASETHLSVSRRGNRPFPRILLSRLGPYSSFSHKTLWSNPRARDCPLYYTAHVAPPSAAQEHAKASNLRFFQRLLSLKAAR